MSLNKQRIALRYFVTLTIAISLKILPLSNFLTHFNPDWVLLVLIYWMLAAPEKIGIFNAWFVGLLVDVLIGRTLGQQALIYTLTSYTCLKMYKRLRQYSIRQQSLFVFCCLFGAQTLVFCMENIKGSAELNWSFLFSIIVGTLCWPLIYWLLQFIYTFTRIE